MASSSTVLSAAPIAATPHVQPAQRNSRLHQLRHSSATHLGEANVSANVIMARPGTRACAASSATSNPASPQSARPPSRCPARAGVAEPAVQQHRPDSPHPRLVSDDGSPAGSTPSPEPAGSLYHPGQTPKAWIFREMYGDAGYARWLSAVLIPSRRAEDLLAGWWRLLESLGAVPRVFGSGRRRRGRPAPRRPLRAHRRVSGVSRHSRVEKVLVCKPRDPLLTGRNRPLHLVVGDRIGRMTGAFEPACG